MKAWLRLMGRMLHLTPSWPWSKSGQQNLEKEERALNMTPVLGDLQLPWTKKQLPPELSCQSPWPIYGWPTTDFQAHNCYFGCLTPKYLEHFEERTGYKCMRKVSVRWVTKLMTDSQKHDQFSISLDNLLCFEGNPADFLDRFATMDEKWGWTLCAWKKATVKAMETLLLIPVREGRGCPVSKESHGMVFGGCWWNFNGGFSSEGSYSNWTILCDLVVAVVR